MPNSSFAAGGCRVDEEPGRFVDDSTSRLHREWKEGEFMVVLAVHRALPEQNELRSFGQRAGAHWLFDRQQ